MSTEAATHKIVNKLSWFTFGIIGTVSLGVGIGGFFSPPTHAEPTEQNVVNERVEKSFVKLQDTASSNCELSDKVDAPYLLERFDDALLDYNKANFYANEMKIPATGYPYPIEAEQIDATNWCKVSDDLDKLSHDIDKANDR